MTDPDSPAPKRRHFLAILDYGGDEAFRPLHVVTQKLGGSGFLLDREPERFGRQFAGASPGLARLGALALHRGLKSFGIHMERAFAQRVLSEIERKTIGIIEFERDTARQGAALRQIAACLIENRKSAGERVAEAGFFEPQSFDDQRLGTQKLRVGLAHLTRQCRNEPPHQRLLRAKHLRMAHGAAHDPAQHITAALVGGQDTIGDEKRGGAQMIGNDPVARAYARHRDRRR